MTLENSHDISIRFLLCLTRVNDREGEAYYDEEVFIAYTHIYTPFLPPTDSARVHCLPRKLRVWYRARD